MTAAVSRFQRFLLAGLGFESVLIGEGYTTGRELSEFFLPGGPQGGVMRIALATLVWIAGVLPVGSIFVADRFGLIALIAHGHRALAWIVLAVYVLPLLTIGAWRLWHQPRATALA